MVTRQRVVLVGALIGLALWLPGHDAAAQPQRPKITQVFVDFETDTIEIEGENFDRVSPLTITLGDPGTIGDITEECVVDTASAPQAITCTLVDGLPEPGDYLLTLAGGPPAWTVSYDLTIGEEEASFTASCPAGSAIRGINADGSVTCEFDTGENLSILQESLNIGPGQFLSGTATCPVGQLINGGYLCTESQNLIVAGSRPVSATTWQIEVRNSSPSDTYVCFVYAQCSRPPIGFPSP